MWLLTMATRNLLRNTRRTLLTLGTIMLGTMMLVIGLSWLGGMTTSMNDSMARFAGEVRVVEPEYAARERLMPLELNIADVAPLEQALTAEGLNAYPLIRTGVTVSVGDEIGDNFGMMVGSTQGYFQDVMDLDERVLEGRWLEGEEEIVIGRTLARDLKAQLGDEVLLLGMTQDGSISPIAGPLVGVVDAGDAMSNRQAFVSLERARYLTDIPDGALELLVYQGDAAAAGELAERMRGLPVLQDYQVDAWYERSPYDALYSSTDGIMVGLAASVVFITALGVLNTMLMSVLERTAEIGVLRALGMKGRTVVLSFLAEASVLGVLGASLGVLAALPFAFYLEANGLDMGQGVTEQFSVPMDTVFYADFTPDIAAVALLCGVFTALVGALLPASRATQIQPVDAMRSRR